MGADSVVQGPPTSAQLFGTEGLVLDAVNSNLYVFGKSRVPVLVGSTLNVVPPQTALSAITSARQLFTYVFGAGVLNVVGRTFVVSGTMIYSTTAANVATISIALLLGPGSALATITTAATNTAASTNLPIQFSFTVTVLSTGSAGTLLAVGNVNANIGTAASGALTAFGSTTTGASAAVNLLTAENLSVTIAASAAVPSAQLLNATVELVA